MPCRLALWIAFLVVGMAASAAVALEPAGIVYQSEAISQPKEAWQLNRGWPTHWKLWTQEADIERKRSGGAVLASPPAAADRQSPEEGAPPLHSVVTDLKPGLYQVYASAPNRPLAYSLDGKTWARHTGGEVDLGMHNITDGRFELWVDDRFAHPPENPGPAYYDYLRFVPLPPTAANVERREPWQGLEYGLRTSGRGFVVPVDKLQRDGFQWIVNWSNPHLLGQAAGDRFSHTIERAGNWYLGILAADDRDATGHLEIALGERVLGSVLARPGQNRVGLYCLQEPITLRQGDRLGFTCRGNVKSFRVEGLVFATTPLVMPPVEFAHLETWSPEKGRVEICWTTTQIVPTGVVEYGVEGFDQKTIASSYEGRNHRVWLTGLDPEKTYQARLVTECKGQPLVSPTLRFRPSPKQPSPTQPQVIELTVPEPTGAARQNWPATIGFPFGRGKLAEVADLRLFDEQGGKAPLQAEVFSRWPDGSVKWAALSFLANTRLGDSPARYRLESRPDWPTPAPGAGPLASLEARDDGWRVTTPHVEFDLTKLAASPLNRIGFDRNGDGRIADDERLASSNTNLALVLADGTSLFCGPPDAPPQIEVNGPVRAVVRWSGPLVSPGGPQGWRYQFRATLWQGQTALGLDATVCNATTEPLFQVIRSLEFRVPLGERGIARGGFQGEALTSLPNDTEGLWLLQDKDNRFRQRTAAGVTEGKRATGVAVADDGRSSVLVVLPDFWQTYPKAFTLKQDALHVGLLPQLAQDTYADEDSRKWFYLLYGWFQDGNYLVRAGQTIRHQVLLRYGPVGQAKDTGRDVAWLAQALLPQASPAYLCATGALSRPLVPQTKGVWDDYEQLFETTFQASLEDREQRRTYSWMHFGDWFGERLLNFGNNEYDLAWALGVQWLRTGDRRYFQRGLEMARHYTTVDTLSGPLTERNRGIVWTHCFNHFGSGLPREQLHFPTEDRAVRTYFDEFANFAKGVIDAQGHIYQEGNWLYAALTGDRLLWEVAQRVCDTQAERLTPSFNFSIERAGGWPLINAVAAYQFSGNPYYLNAARLMIQRCLERENPATGAWPYWHCNYETDDQIVFGGKAFAVGILGYGVLRYLDAEPLDRPEVRRMAVRAADWLIEESWCPGKGFRYISNCPKYRDWGNHGMFCVLNTELVAYAYQQTREAKYHDFWYEMMEGTLTYRVGGMGKNVASYLRQTIFGLDLAHRLGWETTLAPSVKNARP